MGDESMWPLTVLYNNLIEMVAHQVKHRVNMDHIRVHIHYSQDDNKNEKCNPLLPPPKRDSQKGDQVAGDVANQFSIATLKSSYFFLDRAKSRRELKEIEYHDDKAR